MEELDDFSTGPKKRPDLLTAICVLSLVNAGYKMIDAITSMTANSEDSVAEIEKAMEDMPDEAPSFVSSILGQTADVAVKATENAIPMGVSQLILFAISAVGAYMMFKMAKKGFYLYTAANVLALAIPFVFLGSSSLVLITVGMAALFTALFIGLYASNLKHLS